MTAHYRYDDDPERVRRLERRNFTRDNVARRRHVLSCLVPRAGERIVDIGCGAGFLAREVAGIVGAAGSVLAVDVSEKMLELTTTRCADAPWVRVARAGAEDLPVPDASLDAAVSTQVLEYVEDVDRALAAVFRVLRPGGRVLILDADWDTAVWHSRDPDRMRRVLKAFEPHCVHPRLPRTLPARLRGAGFHRVGCETFATVNTRFDEDSFSYWFAPSVAAFTSGREGLNPAEVRDWAEELTALDAAGDYFFSVCFFSFTAVKRG